MSSITKAWYSRHPLLNLLLPFSGLFRVAVSIRKFLYRSGVKRVSKFSVPIIIVGNITVGGTGKTPLCIWLAKFLQDNGYKPGLVSRGYGGRLNKNVIQVTEESNANDVGDEALLLARRTECPVVISTSRVKAVETLLANNSCDVVISDDGLQHYALARDIEIAVVDGSRRFGNGKCLPAGPLREPVKRILQMDFVVTNGANNQDDFGMHLQAEAFCNLVNGNECGIEKFENKKIYAVAAIGNPPRFFQQLQAMGLDIVEHAFPDHYKFKSRDLDFGEDAIVIMTEKDAVKCKDFASENLWYMPVRAELNKDFQKALLAKMKSL